MLHLAGQIIGPWVEELQRACDHRLAAGTVALDLSEVSFVARRGVELLRSLRIRGVPLVGCSAFVARQRCPSFDVTLRRGTMVEPWTSHDPMCATTCNACAVGTPSFAI